MIEHLLGSALIGVVVAVGVLLAIVTINARFWPRIDLVTPANADRRRITGAYFAAAALTGVIVALIAERDFRRACDGVDALFVILGDEALQSARYPLDERANTALALCG